MKRFLSTLIQYLHSAMLASVVVIDNLYHGAMFMFINIVWQTEV